MPIDKNAVIKDAQKFASKGQFDKAIGEWKKIAKESPNDANVFNTIGDLCLKKNAKADAVDAYKKAADILASDGFTSKAIALYKKVLNIDPKKVEAHLALADLNAEKGLTGNALESYKLVADHYTRNKETAKALAIYQKMADLNSSNVSFRIKLAEMYVKEGMKKEAIKAFLQAADVHISKDAFKEARQIFEKALGVDQNNKDVYHKAGLVYFKEGKFVEACKALKPAFDGDPSNAELADLYLQSLEKAGRGTEAEEVCQKLLSEHPDRADLREKLYRIYLAQNETDKAFSEVSTLVNLKIETKDLDAAEEVLKEFLAAAPRSIDGRRALSALYKTIGKGDQAADMLVEAADLLVQDDDRNGAQEALSKAIELAPGHDKAGELLERLKTPRPSSETPSFVQDTLAAAPFPPEGLEPEAMTPPPAPVRPSGTPEDTAVAEALAEVEVLVKYGLGTKALEQLETLAKKHPRSIPVRIKLRDLYGDQGDLRRAAGHMVLLADLYSAQGINSQAEQTLREALAMDPNNAGIQARLGMEPAEPSGVQFQEAPLQGPADISMPVSEGLDMVPADDGEELSFPGAGGGEIAFEEPAQASPAPEDLSFDQPFSVPDFEPAEHREEAGTEPASREFAEPQPFEDVASEAPAFSEPAFGLPSTESEPAESIDISELWAEAEFYYQQGLFDEARKHYEKIIEHDPANAQARDRIADINREQEDVQEFSKLADAVDGLERYDSLAGDSAPAGAMAASASDEEAVRSLMEEIAQLKQKSTPVKEKRPAPPQSPARKERTDVRRGEDFFDLGEELNAIASSTFSPEGRKGASDVSDDFFDLAAELRDELSSVSVPPPSASGEEQSLDDIFEEFKKGVEQQASKEDADTHYNLGVAYKEMGLLDDAIGEFTMTPEEDPKYFQSRYMLGLCFLEKGEYQSAIAEIQTARSSAEGDGALSQRDQIAMSYDLGLAYQGAGNIESALREFQKVLAADPDYRDAGEKINELQQGETISQEQLKDDIEREISSKFLEEGERIEREEKTRKTEKVRQ